MKAVAVDTNIAIEILNGNSAIIERLKRYRVVYIPVTVSGELLFGAKKSKRRDANLKVFRDFIGKCETLDINHKVAESYSDIRIDLYKMGKPIPENDLWIAAICVTNNVPLITRDKHFSNIKKLKRVAL